MLFRPRLARWAPGLLLAVLGCSPSSLTLTGIVTTNDVMVGSQVTGRVDRLLVSEGDQVTAGQLLAVIAPEELRADSAYYAHSADGMSAQVRQAEAYVRWQAQQTTDRIRQAEASVAAAEAQRNAAKADLDLAELTFKRVERLAAQGLDTPAQLDQARATLNTSTARLDAAARQAESAVASLALAKSDAEQNVVRQSQLDGSRQSLAAAAAQRTKAGVRLGYTELRSPIDGVIDVRVARQGEIVSIGQPVLTVVNPDDLWVRADVEESYIDRVRIGDSLSVRFSSGDIHRGAVFFRGVDASYATRRDVSRTKRDVKTFEVRIRLDNKERRMALGMTAYVLLPVGR